MAPACTAGKFTCRECHQTKACADFSAAATQRGHRLQCTACYRARRTHQRHAPAVGPLIACYWCGTRFTPTHDRKTYCSNACSGLAHRKADASPVYFPTCALCGRTFAARRKGRKYCSNECAWRYGYADTLVKPRPFDCVDCGTTFTQHNAHTTRCKPCAADHLDATRQAAKALRRTRQRTNGVPERISRRAIYERDRWTCYLCGTRVHTQAAPTDPLSPTLDHVMPLALGGTHTAGNLRLACRACNLAKGATFLVSPPVDQPVKRRPSRTGP